MKKRKVEPGAAYLNVDLEIRSRSNLMPLADALRPHLFVLHAGRIGGAFLASFEVPGVTQPPDVTIKRLARAISNLPPSVRKLWRRAGHRVFDIGLETAAGRGAFALALRPETVKTIARLNARLALTLYPLKWGEPRKVPNKALQRPAAPGARR